MDTKSPNKKNNGRGFAQYVCKLIIFLLSFVFIASAALLTCEKNIHFKSYFYDSENIRTEAIRYAKNLQRYYVYFQNFDPTVAERKINEIDEYLRNERNIVADTSSKPNYYNVESFEENGAEEEEQTSRELYNDTNPEELYDIDVSQLDDMTADDILSLENNLSETVQNYYSVRNYLDTNEHFHFYLYNTRLGRLVATNADNFNQETVYDSISVTSSDLFSDIKFGNVYLADSFIQNGLECTLSIPVDSSSYFIKNEVENVKRLVGVNKVLSSPITPILMIAVGMLLFGYVVYSDRQFVNRVNNIIYSRFKMIPLILKLMVTASFILLYVGLYGKYSYLSELLAYGKWDVAFLMVIAAVLMLMFVIMTIENIYSHIRNPQLIRQETDVNFAIVSFKNFMFALRTHNYLLIFIYVTVSFLFVVEFIITVFCLPQAFTSYQAVLLYFFRCFVLFVGAMVIKLINAHIKLCWYIKEMALGNIEIIPKQHGLFVEPLNNLNNINDGVKRTMEEAIKNERLKSELITNVSHDLKTPLTSIISYVNLLKELDINDKAAEDYIDVIENKATRLKILIDDLFEASKLSSGQMKLEKNPSDVVSLLKQTLGELSYKIDESGIEFKTDFPETPVILNIDGQKMWRVFDNMLNNILKYSPKGSRAYIDVVDKEDRTVITFKNVSSYSLDFDTGELFERFKRGDAARATEGSGLGLSIAKSIVDLHGGNMSIVTDGDLFKVIIILYKSS